MKTRKHRKELNAIYSHSHGTIMENFTFNNIPKIISELDQDFRPPVLANKAFIEAVNKIKNPVKIRISLERTQGQTSSFDTVVFNDDENQFNENCYYLERLIKSLLWIKGGWKITFGGPQSLGSYIKDVFSKTGSRQFDVKFMSRIYEKEFLVEIKNIKDVPQTIETSKPLGRHLDGCRIGFDAGGSDRKVSAVVDGYVIYSEEVVWSPKLHSDPIGSL